MYTPFQAYVLFMLWIFAPECFLCYGSVTSVNSTRRGICQWQCDIDKTASSNTKTRREQTVLVAMST